MTISKGALVAKLNTDSLFGTTDEERQKVRRLAAESALSQKNPAGDLNQLLGMLGLLDEPETSEPPVKRQAHPSVGNNGRCTKCGVATYQQHPKAEHDGKRYGGRGMCQACYVVVRRAERKADR